MTNSSNEKKEKMKWAMIIYKGQRNDIRFVKNQQWKTTYYTILIYAGIFYLFKDKVLYFCIKPFSGILFLSALLITSLLSIIILWKMHKDIIIYRKIVKIIEKNYPVIKDLSDISKIPTEGYKNNKLYPIIFSLIIAFGAAIVFLYKFI
jgi:hypothetical protein